MDSFKQSQIPFGGLKQPKLQMRKKKQIGNEADQSESKEAEGASVRNQPPEEMKIVKEETGREQQGKSQEETQRQQSKGHVQRLYSKPSQLASYNKGETKVEPGKLRKPHNVKRQACAGLQVESVLQIKTGHVGLISCHFFFLQDGRIDYNEFVAMMQRGNPEFGKKGCQGKGFSIGYLGRHHPVC